MHNYSDRIRRSDTSDSTIMLCSIFAGTIYKNDGQKDLKRGEVVGRALV